MPEEFLPKFRSAFGDRVVYKDLQNSGFLMSLNLPSFMRDWLLSSFQDAQGQYENDKVTDFVHEFLPNTDQWNKLKAQMVTSGESVKLVAKIKVDVDVRTSAITFSLPDYNLKNNETRIDSHVWERYKEELVSGREVWGVMELRYSFPQEKPKIPGAIKLINFKNFCPNSIDADALDAFKEARAEFTLLEWLDVILGAIDYNAEGYASQRQKLALLARLLPFVEPRLNLIELAPKGTGKSYLYGRLSRYGWLSSGGTMTRAKMFYDLSKRSEGLVSNNDFITLDEIQTISFPDVSEMRAALKGYLESGKYSVGNYQGTGTSGVALCGNISHDAMTRHDRVNMFTELPDIFHESALIERFHGFIKGWEIPRMTESLKVCGWALNCDYFCSVLHALRSDPVQRQIVDELIDVPNDADTRHTEAVKRIAVAWMKLLFPHVRKAEDISYDHFNTYCFEPAYNMRDTILNQLQIMDAEYRTKHMPNLQARQIGRMF